MQTHLTPLDWAFQQPDLPETPKFVLVTLAKHADTRDFTCFPSIERVASLCGVKLRAAQYALADLIHSGYVVICGFKEWGAPIYQLAVGKAVRWLGRLRKYPPAPSAPPAQGALFSAPSAPKPMHEVHTVTSHVPELPIEHKERERDARATSSSVEFVSIGNGYKVTTAQFARMKERFAEHFDEVIHDILDYGETNTIGDFFALAMRWRVRQPERRKFYGKGSDDPDAPRRWSALFENRRMATPSRDLVPSPTVG